MLGVVLVPAPVEQLDARGQMLRLVPGVGIYRPAAGRQQARAEYEQRQGQPRRWSCARAGDSGQSYAPNGCRRTIVCSRSGPVEIMSIGTLTSDCSRSR